MLEKIGFVMGSLRFWLLTVAMFGAQANEMLAGTWSLESAITIISAWTVAVAAVGTIDRFAEEVG